MYCFSPINAEKVSEYKTPPPVITAEEQHVAPEEEIVTVVQEEPETKTPLGVFKLSAYCKENYPHCCNDGDSSQTATGTTPVPGRTIAVDPSVIPYGSEVEIFGHTYIAEDCGCSVKGNHIDVLFATHQEAVNFGIQYADVAYIEKEVA